MIMLLVLQTLLLTLVSSDSLPIYPIGECKDMFITYYDASSGGSCNLGRGSPTGMGIYTAAPNSNFRADPRVCGTCYELIGSKGSIKVVVTDTCPDCQTDVLHFDLSQEAFEAIEEKIVGNAEITYRPVSCDVEGPVKYKWIPESQTTGHYFSIIMFNHAVGVESVEVWQNDQWEKLFREAWNEFKWSNRGQFQLPSKFRVTSFFGDSIEKDIEEILPDEVESLSRQFEVPEEEYEPYKNTCCEPYYDPTYIYYDDTTHGWNDWTPKGNPKYSGGVEGSYCYQGICSNWQECIQFGKNDGQVMSDYSGMEFYAKSNMANYAGLNIYLYQFNPSEVHTQYVPVTIGTSWTKISVNFTDVKLTELNKIAWKNGMDGAVTLYIDQAKLVERADLEEKDYCVDGIAQFDDDGSEIDSSKGIPTKSIMGFSFFVMVFLILFVN